MNDLNNNDEMFQRLGQLANESTSQISGTFNDKKNNDPIESASNVAIRWQPPPIQMDEMNDVYKRNEAFVIKNKQTFSKPSSTVSSIFASNGDSGSFFAMTDERCRMYNTIFCATMLCLCVMILFMIIVLIVSFIYINNRDRKKRKIDSDSSTESEIK